MKRKETYLSRDFRDTAAQRFPAQAKQLNAAFDMRLNALLAENADASKEKQYHLKRQILPGIAAYETLQRVMPKEEALQTVHGYVERLARTSHKQLAALLHILHTQNPACVCEISVIFFVFRYTLGLPQAPRLSRGAWLCISRLKRNKTMPNPVIADREKIQCRFWGRGEKRQYGADTDTAHKKHKRKTLKQKLQGLFGCPSPT